MVPIITSLEFSKTPETGIKRRKREKVWVILVGRFCGIPFFPGLGLGVADLQLLLLLRSWE